MSTFRLKGGGYDLIHSFAFTMAEILLSLTIIGVVAAITLPSLTGNINERTWNTQRKALYARMSQALSLMPYLNGYGTLTEGSGSEGTSSYIEPEDTAAGTFITEGLSKVLKINNICDNEHLEDCGIPTAITTLNGSLLNSFTTSYNTLFKFNNNFSGSWVGVGTYSQLDTKAAAFETANGESVLIYYNPSCVPDMQETSTHFSQSKMCVNFVYDLNGNKGPNTVGKDIGFISALYPSDPTLVAPLPLATNAGDGAFEIARSLCSSQDSESRLPNREELAAIFYNNTLVGTTLVNYWSSKVISTNGVNKTWYLNFTSGVLSTVENGHCTARCIKR